METREDIIKIFSLLIIIFGIYLTSIPVIKANIKYLNALLQLLKFIYFNIEKNSILIYNDIINHIIYIYRNLLNSR